MPNYAYHWARAEGALVRQIYRAFLPKIIRRKITPPDSVPFEVFAYSGHDTLPEQVASIRSFLRYAGRPTRFTVVSDGTYTEQRYRVAPTSRSSRFRWKNCHRFHLHLPSPFASYLRSHLPANSWRLLCRFRAMGRALYVDSDVIFFANAHDLVSLVSTSNVSAFYLSDCQFSGDARLIRSPNERESSS